MKKSIIYSVFAVIFASLGALSVLGYQFFFPSAWERTIRYGRCGAVQPVAAPFAVEKAGTRLSCEVIIEDEGSYEVDIRYFFGGNRQEHGRVGKIAGGYEYDPTIGVWKDVGKGGPVIIKYVVKSVENGQIIKESTETDPVVTSSDGDYLYAVIGAFSLLPGRYEITLESLKDVPEMITVRTDLAIRARNIAN